MKKPTPKNSRAASSGAVAPAEASPLIRIVADLASPEVLIIDEAAHRENRSRAGQVKTILEAWCDDQCRTKGEV